MRALLCALALAAAAIPAAAQELPEGPGREVLTAACLGCHHDDMIRQQRLSKAAWEREIDKMVGWGAHVDAGRRATLAEYLATHFGLVPAVSHDPAAVAAGETVFQRACLSCHGREMVEQQQLPEAAWTREVTKMMGWGARVPEADKAALVAFLTARHGPGAP